MQWNIFFVCFLFHAALLEDRTWLSRIQVGAAEGDGKSVEVKERTPVKQTGGSLGSLNMITGKSVERDKASGASTNGVESER